MPVLEGAFSCQISNNILRGIFSKQRIVSGSLSFPQNNEKIEQIGEKSTHKL